MKKLILLILISLFMSGCFLSHNKSKRLQDQAALDHQNHENKLKLIRYIQEKKIIKKNQAKNKDSVPENQYAAEEYNLPTCPGPLKDGTSSIWNNCIGFFAYANGDKYVGEWKNNKNNGQGALTFANGAKYVGEFEDNKLNGQGTFTWPDGAKYVGEIKYGKKHGQGTWYFANGAKYVGELKDNKLNGQGTFTWPDGLKYVGAFKDGKKHGQGTQTWADGQKYIGEYKDNKKHGQGTLNFANGEKHVGEYKDDRINGHGTWTFGKGKWEGDVYVGEHKDGRINGQGTYTFADGRVWQGQWKDFQWVTGKKYAAGEYNPSIKEGNKKQNINPNEIINAASGSGFIVSSSGHIVTNNHVINGCNEVKIHYNGEQYKASIISKDDHNDLALLKANFTPSTIFTIKNGNAELMEDIYVAGYPFGDLFNSSVKITKGIVSSLSGFQNNFSNMQIDAALQPGNSGGPVIDYQGNVVGVAVAKLDLSIMIDLFKSVPENTNFAIKSSVLLNFLNSNGIQTKKASEQIMPRTELSEKITKGTLFLSCWMTYARIEEMKSQKVLFNDIIK